MMIDRNLKECAVCKKSSIVKMTGVIEMVDIEKITFDLENNARIKFSINDFIKLSFDDVSKINKNEYVVNKIKMVLSKSANKKSKYELFDGFELPNDLFTEIINIPNIDSIKIHLSDRIIELFPIYDGISFDKNGTNTFQVGKIDKNGNLVISIKERQ